MKPETIAIHGAFKGDPSTHAVAVPLYQTTSYFFDDAQHGADLFDLKVPGNIYTRIMNPTTDVLEQRIAALEGGIAALAFASGMAAITATVATLAEAGDNIISVNQLYGGTQNFFAHSLRKTGVETRFFDADAPEQIHALIDENTKLLFCESIGNPAGNVADLEALAAIAHTHGIPLVVDNTVPTPALCQPIAFGADIVVHSLTKYIGGHGTSIGGMVVDSGKFEWAGNPRFAAFNEPDQSYHGVVFVDVLGPAAFIGKARVGALRSNGGVISPFNSFLILQGLETLTLRMERHVSNALQVAEYLNTHPQVSKVIYAGLQQSRYYQLAEKYTGGNPSALVSFEVAAGEDAAKAFIDRLELITRLVNIGDAKSLACHPASTTHRQLQQDELAAANVSHNMVRLSVGIEHIDDIISDIEQALQ